MLLAPGHPLFASGFSLAGTVWEEAGISAGVAPELVYAVALAESRRLNGKDTVSPWPWTLNIEGKGYYFETAEEAKAKLEEALGQGIKSIDVGPMQVNLVWNGFRVENPSELFDLGTAAKVGALILKEAIASYPTDLTIGVGRYHNWEDSNRAHTYGTRVLKFHNVIVQAGTHQ